MDKIIKEKKEILLYIDVIRKDASSLRSKSVEVLTDDQLKATIDIELLHGDKSTIIQYAEQLMIDIMNLENIDKYLCEFIVFITDCASEFKKKSMKKIKLLFVEGFYDAVYALGRQKKTFSFEVSGFGESDFDKDLILLNKTRNDVKRLVDTPANICTPQTFLNDIKKTVKKSKNLSICAVIDDNKMLKLGMNAFHAVGNGSVNRPLMIHVVYKPDKKKGNNHKKVVLVGKGLTYDSGGLSIKPSTSMDMMQIDKGAASLLFGLMKYLGKSERVQIDKEVHFFFAMAENMISSNSYRPGDILTAMNGKTITVKNTDAEGRLVLFDTMCYAQEKLNDIDLILDVATLTGASAAFFGKIGSAINTPSKELKTSFLDSAQENNEIVFRMPYDKKYENSIVPKTKEADISNVGENGAGQTTAALFLKHSLKEENINKWIHWDIAGPYSNIYPANAHGFKTLLGFVNSYSNSSN